MWLHLVKVPLRPGFDRLPVHQADDPLHLLGSIKLLMSRQVC
jgi:hypothetical protein